MQLIATNKSFSRKAGDVYECSEPLASKLIAKGVATTIDAMPVEKTKEVKQPKTRKK